MLASVLTAILFSLSAVCGTRTAKLLGGVSANFWRLLLATLFLACWAHLFGGGVAGPAFPYFLVSGVIGFGMGDLALFQSLPRLGSRLSVLLVQCLAAPLAAVTEWLWLGTGLTPWQWLCGGLILLGVVVALAPAEHLQQSSRTIWIGVAFALVAALGQGLGAVLSRKAFAVAHLAAQPVDGITAAYQRVLGGVAVGGLFLWILRWFPRPAPAGGGEAPLSPGHPWRAAWPWVVLNSLAGPTLGVSCFQWALRATPSGVVLPIVATTPLVVIPFTYFLEGDRPGWRAYLGGLLAVLGAIGLASVP